MLPTGKVHPSPSSITHLRPTSKTLSASKNGPTVATNPSHWDPQNSSKHLPTPPPFSAPSAILPPLSRYILSLLSTHRTWGPPLLASLSKLRRVTPDVIVPLLRYSHPSSNLSPKLYTRLFHWASRQKGFSHTYASYNALTYFLNRNNLSRMADQVPALMKAHGKEPTEMQLEILVRMHIDAGRGRRLYYVYRKMRDEFGVKPRVFLYNRILDGLVKLGHLDLGFLVWEDLKNDGLKEEAITFMIMVKGLCKAKRVDEAVEVLGKMRREVCKPDVFAYTSIVNCLVKEKEFDGCLRIWEEMNKYGVDGDVMAYRTLVNGLCGDGRMEKGLELFREMKRKKLLVDRSVYGDLIKGFVKVGKVEEGCRILKEMVVDGYRPDLGVYGFLIGGLCEIAKVDKAYKLFQICVSEGLALNYETVTPLFVLFVELNAMEKFFMLIDKICGLGLSVSDHLANFFKVFIEKGGRELKALNVFEELKVKGFCSVVIYNILIEALYLCGEVNRALHLFEEIKRSEVFEPDSCTFNLAIPCYVDIGKIKEACACYCKMKEMSWMPSIASYDSLVKGLCKFGEITDAITLVKDCLGSVADGPIAFKYILTILNASRSRKPEKVLEVLDEMVEEGHQLEDIIYCAVIYGFCKHAHSEEARKVFEVMKSRNVLSEARYIVYVEMLNEHLTKTTAGLVISTLKFFGLESKVNLKSPIS